MVKLGFSKVEAKHLARQALVYIRQSTFIQVRDNIGSTMRQYDLTQRALELGWPEPQIRVIDQDQAHSGATSVNRDGFQLVVAEVGLQHIGAVFCLEASRLARANSDWYRLLEICALTDTLVVDEDGIYDPGDYNDRLLLGIKGTMSEAELHWLRQRLLGGKLAKAEQGQLRMRPPTGLVYDPTGQVVLDPDEEVHHAVALVFSLFDQHRSAMAVVTHFKKHHLRFPTRLWGGVQDGEVRWDRLRHARVLSMLHNPAYAGVYVYGRTQTRRQVLPGEAPRIKGRQRQVAQAEWPIVHHQAHGGYISWEQFLQNQQQLDDNRTFHPDQRRGAVREGTALLQGLVLCGVCGRRMSVRYYGQGIPHYQCNQAHTRLGDKTCQSFRGDGVEAAVAQCFLEALCPAQLEVSLATLDFIEVQARQVEQQWKRRLERVDYEVDLARRRFLSVEPENRLVARTLERDWNERLTEAEQLRQEYAALPARSLRLVTAEERQAILALAQDLPQLWQAPSTTNAQRKQLLRLLVKDVTLTKQGKLIQIGLRWQTGALTALSAARPLRAGEAVKTPPAVLDRIRALSPDHSDTQIARQLNLEGFKPGRNGQFTRGKISWIRGAYRIPTGCADNPVGLGNQPRGDGRYSARAVAELLNVTVSTIADWCEAGLLDSIQATPHAPRWIKLMPEDITRLRKPKRRRWLKYS
ncbi:MAG: recombinase family protein [Chloroflexi bacterium]|nr:recombinase family protein [Chloroflexota bacterium]